MSVQNVSAGATQEGHLELSWKLMGPPPVAVSVQIAKDSEFLDTPRTFVVNPCEAITLDTGAGRWYYRVGAWVGTEKRGVIEWSGIYGPAAVVSQKGIVPTAPPSIHIHHTQPALESVVFHTGVYEPYYLVIDTTFQASLSASTAKTTYLSDWGKASVAVDNLSADQTYSFRLAAFLGGSRSRGTLPAAGEIKQLEEGLILRNKRAAANVRATTFTDSAVYAADRVLLKEAREKQSLRFSSYADYMQYLAARARTTERRQGV